MAFALIRLGRDRATMEDIHVERGEQYCRITLANRRLDVLLAPALKSEFVVLAGLGSERVVLDLSSCDYCDSAGLSAILMGHRLCSNGGGVLVLTGVSESVERLVRIAQLDSVLNLAYTPEQLEEFLTHF